MFLVPPSLQWKKFHLILLYLKEDYEIKNNLTLVRGEWGGDSGEKGLQELLTIKDIWTKSRGKVEAGEGGGFGWGWGKGWGENSDNCN